MTRNLGLIFLLLLCLAFGLTAFLMPVSHDIVRLLFIEDACWTVSWLIFAWTSFKLKKTEYPAKAMAITLAVEVYLFYHYTIRTSWPFNHWLLINYLLWPMSSCLNLVATYLYGSGESVTGRKRSSFFLKLMLEVAIYFALFWYAADLLSQKLVMVIYGQTVIGIISLCFLTRTLTERNPGSRSLIGNLFRMMGGILCFYANSVIWKDEHGSLPYLRVLMPMVMMMDLVTVLKIGFTSPKTEE